MFSLGRKRQGHFDGNFSGDIERTALNLAKPDYKRAERMRVPAVADRRD